MHEVSSINGQDGKQFLMNMTSFMIGGLAVDANADKIYFIDVKSDLIKELNMITGQVGTLTYVLSGSGNRIHIFFICSPLNYFVLNIYLKYLFNERFMIYFVLQ